MKLKNGLIILLVLLSFNGAFSQDTVSVYFDIGSSKINETQLAKLKSVKVKYDFTLLDSVHFIGMADSSGRFKANLKLSRKRAAKVADYFADILPFYIMPEIFAKGENTSHELNENRRVDIIFYFPQVDNEVKLKDSAGKPAAITCHYIDYDLLQLCHTRTITKGRKKFTYIEIEQNSGIHSKQITSKSLKEYYSGTLTANGKFQAVRIKWQLRQTGKYWWKRKRFVAILPKKDFEKYKILKKGQTPCPDCYESIENIAAILSDSSCLKLDLFLKENMQAKSAFLRFDKAKVRAPREYINLNQRYYTNCTETPKLSWLTAKGKRKQNYYYTKLHWHTFELTKIYRVMDCCHDSFPQFPLSMIRCGSNGGSIASAYLIAEAGLYYQQSGFNNGNNYAALGISITVPHNRFYLLTGLYFDESFFAAARHQFHLYTLPQLNPVSSWQNYRTYKPPKRYGNIYFGSELKTKLGADEKNFIELNIHGGIASLNKNESAFLQTIFIQYGAGFDFLRNNSSGFYPVFLAGINVNLARLY